MKSKLLMILICLGFISCGTKYVTIEKEVPIYNTEVKYLSNTKVDSIYIHDSINMYIKGDTVFKDKVKLIYKDRLINDTIRITDSIDKPIYLTTTEIKEVNKTTDLQKFFIFSGLFLWLYIAFNLIKKKYNDGF